MSALSTCAPVGASPLPSIVRVLIVDDHPVLRAGVKALLAAEPDMECCGEASCFDEAVGALADLSPDVALIDLSMPGPNGLNLIRHIQEKHPHVRSVAFSVHEESTFAVRALKAGAKGYVTKREASERLVVAIREVVAKGVYITPTLRELLIFKTIMAEEGKLATPLDGLSDREMEVFEQYGAGASTRSIADSLSLSVKTIETHRAHILTKLGFADSAAMVKYAIDWAAHHS